MYIYIYWITALGIAGCICITDVSSLSNFKEINMSGCTYGNDMYVNDIIARIHAKRLIFLIAITLLTCIGTKNALHATMILCNGGTTMNIPNLITHNEN
jgi:hypothetical protein